MILIGASQQYDDAFLQHFAFRQDSVHVKVGGSVSGGRHGLAREQKPRLHG